MSEDVTFYVPGLVLFSAFLLKLPGLRRAWDDTLQRAVCALLLVASLVFAVAAPKSIAAINRWSGVPNLAAPVVYCVLTAFGGCYLVVIVNWQRSPDEGTRRATRWCIGIYAAIIVALIVLFALADAPVERLRDLDTYYAGTPFMREMILLYLVAHMAAAVTVTVLCLRWSLHVTGVLRTGLLLIVLGYFLNLGYDAVKFAAIGARWSGRDWDFLSTNVAPPLASTSALLVGIGFVTPLVVQQVGDQYREVRRFRRLGPLWRALRSTGELGPRTARSWSPLRVRAAQRELDIHDGILGLIPFASPELREAAYAEAVAQGNDPRHAHAIADAAMIAAACVRKRLLPDRQEENPDVQTLPSARTRAGLVLMSSALAKSPLVAAARERAVRADGST